VTASGGSTGGGTVFELTPQGGAWTESVIYNFNNEKPVGGLVFDKEGNLYGATIYGGEHVAGSVFQLTPSQSGGWTETTIYSFGSPQTGKTPISGPIISYAGDLYGLLQDGISSVYGAIYVLKAPVTQGGAWTERVLYSFKVGNGGADPTGRLVFDQKGNLYGVTQHSGAFKAGTVFQLARQGVTWTESTLYSFCSQPHCSDGKSPFAGLIVDDKGNLYGTTYYGGARGNCYLGACGTVFRLTPPATQGGAWTETVLHDFSSSGEDGTEPAAPLMHGKFGSLWGTTSRGGKAGGQCTAFGGCGTVFRVFP
jgi:uncharacterized repeat protein (TIGR03803 family)